MSVLLGGPEVLLALPSAASPTVVYSSHGGRNLPCSILRLFISGRCLCPSPLRSYQVLSLCPHLPTHELFYYSPKYQEVL